MRTEKAHGRKSLTGCRSETEILRVSKHTRLIIARTAALKKMTKADLLHQSLKQYLVTNFATIRDHVSGDDIEKII